MKKYIITASTDPYNALRSSRSKGKKGLEWYGPIITKWIHDDNFGHGYTLKEARDILMDMAREDACDAGEKISHRYFEKWYDYDIWRYRIELMDEYVYEEA